MNDISYNKVEEEIINLIKLKNYSEAVKMLNDILQENINNYTYRAIKQVILNNLISDSLFQEIVNSYKTTNEIEFLYDIGLNLSYNNKDTEAIEYFEKIIIMEVNHIDAYFQLASINFSIKKLFNSKALFYAKKVRELDPLYPLIDVFYKKVNLYNMKFLLNDYKNIYADNSNLHSHRLGVFHYRVELYEQAYNYLAYANLLNDKYYKTNLYLAMAAIKVNKYYEALYNFELAETKNAKDPMIFIEKGKFYIIKQYWDEALFSFTYAEDLVNKYKKRDIDEYNKLINEIYLEISNLKLQRGKYEEYYQISEFEKKKNNEENYSSDENDDKNVKNDKPKDLKNNKDNIVKIIQNSYLNSKIASFKLSQVNYISNTILKKTLYFNNRPSVVFGFVLILLYKANLIK